MQASPTLLLSRHVAETGQCLQDNLLHGRFLAELTKEVFNDLEETKYQHTEYRISIYGRKTVEWDILAAWVCQNKLYSDNNVWLIQVSLCLWSHCVDCESSLLSVSIVISAKHCTCASLL
jgi:hypothetical protein